MQEVKAELLEALKTSRPLDVTTVVQIRLCSNVSGHVSEGKTEWNKVKEDNIYKRTRRKELRKGHDAMARKPQEQKKKKKKCALPLNHYKYFVAVKQLKLKEVWNEAKGEEK